MKYLLTLILFICPYIVLGQDISENELAYVQSESVPVYNDTTQLKVVDTRSISQGVYVKKVFKNWAYIRYSDGKLVNGFIKRDFLDRESPTINRIRKVRKERLARIQARRKMLQDLFQTIESGRLKIGTSAHIIKEKWGDPDRTSTVIDASGKSEQWVYGTGEKIYLHFQNKILTSIQY